MKLSLKSVLAMSLSLVMVLALAACSGGGETSTAAPAGETGGSEAATTGGDRTPITIFRTNDGNGAMEAVIEGFEASQDQYSVNWVEASNDTETTRNTLNTALAAGSSEYDVICIDVVWAGDMAGAGYIEPLDDYIMEAGHNLSDYNPGSLQSGTYKAKTYALPLYPDFGVLYFRSDIVSEEDAQKLVSGDYTFEELIAMAETYNGQEGTTQGLNFQANQYEGLVCNANEWTNNYTDLQAIEVMKQAVDSSATPEDILKYQESESADTFTNGDAVFSRNWPYVWGVLGEGGPVSQDQVDIAPLPNGSCIGGWLLAMNSFSENKDGAWALLDYMTSEEGQKIFCGTGGYNPGWNALLDDEEFLSMNELMTKPGYIAALENTIARPISDEYNELSDNLQIAMHTYLSGNADLDTTVSEMEALLGGGSTSGAGSDAGSDAGSSAAGDSSVAESGADSAASEASSVSESAA
ncbi:extracellular solute-binding protein [Ruminococcaceae bacterium OttesenSCG-928-I18]|nr:extracellular solute-binding protein [Ruminococcaceae bacterium OttesenSCG-928-I18]